MIATVNTVTVRCRIGLQQTKETHCKEYTENSAEHLAIWRLPWQR